MGEIDTNPIQPVQMALSLLGEKGDHHWKNRSTGNDKQDEKERELENVLTDLASYKVQLEAKEAAYMQALLELDHSQKSVHELSILLKENEAERQQQACECRDARARIEELESEATKIHEQFFLVLLESEAREIVHKETQSEKREELEKLISALNGAILASEKEKHEMLSEIELGKQALLEAQEKIEELRETKRSNERKISGQERFIEALESETHELRLELQRKNETKLTIHLTGDPSHLTWPENRQEMEGLRKELDDVRAKVSEMRNRAEQANFRAEMAERAKSAIEEQLRKWREERQKKKLALVKSGEFNVHITNDKPKPTYYQPLYKVLNMKF